MGGKGLLSSSQFLRSGGNAQDLRGTELALIGTPWPIVVQTVGSMSYAALLATIVPGYLFGSRLFGNHVRQTAQTWFAWVVTLACYPPLLEGVFDHWLQYHAYSAHPWWREPWVVRTGDASFIAYAIGGLILLFDLTHFWGEAIFGLRASNLTNRGIITNGPYRVVTKHPVYIAKCFAWFLAWLPLVATSHVLHDVRLTALFGGVCLLYGMRAYAEEMLLATDPVYVEYALWMDEHGWFRHLKRFVPALAYRWRVRLLLEKAAMPE